jgi:DNA-binding NtrC family response regulator
VLVIDDHPAMGMSLKLMLSPEHEVEVAATPEAALALLQGSRFDLVLCDVIMPGMSGLELFARVSARDGGLAQRFVLMTGGATSPAMAEAIEGSKLRVLEKPFDPELLRGMLRD